MKLAGAMIFSIDTDDFRGDYGKKYPLLNVSSYGKNDKKVTTLWVLPSCTSVQNCLVTDKGV